MAVSNLTIFRSQIKITPYPFTPTPFMIPRMKPYRSAWKGGGVAGGLAEDFHDHKSKGLLFTCIYICIGLERFVSFVFQALVVVVRTTGHVLFDFLFRLDL